jgi:hypothetical protein
MGGFEYYLTLCFAQAQFYDSCNIIGISREKYTKGIKQIHDQCKFVLPHIITTPIKYFRDQQQVWVSCIMLSRSDGCEYYSRLLEVHLAAQYDIMTSIFCSMQLPGKSKRQTEHTISASLYYPDISLGQCP